MTIVHSDPQHSIQTDAVTEDLRLATLQSYDILDTPPELAFDRVSRLIRNIYDVPISLVSLMAANRQWFKANIGLDIESVERENTVCQFVIRSGEPLFIPDLSKDPRFKNNPFVIGEAHLRFYAGMPLRAPDGMTLGTLCAIDHVPRQFGAREIEIMSDLADIVMNELELRRTAEVDVLTRVLSRRAFKGQSKQIIELMQRQGKPSSVVMFDIDHFKSINDSYGHAAGDDVLVNIAQTCQSQIRSTDLIGRLGGEEFAVLLPGTTQHDALRVAEKIRLALAETPISLGKRDLNVTASFGIATTMPDALSLDALLAIADAGLYEAKARGRNRVVSLQAC